MNSKMKINKAIKFTSRPDGRPTSETFELTELDYPRIKSGQFLLKNIYLSMDPALVGRMREESNYADSVSPGEVMHCYAISQVVESKHPKVKVGEVRLGRFDMQEYSVANDPSDSNVINLGLAEAHHYLSATGITGGTAFFALFDICKPKKGETIIISAGASSVGSLAAQLAKQVGCKTVAIVSTEEKALRAKIDWGYDEAISYRNKTIEELSADIGLACPEGIDMYFDNTSGDISEAVFNHYNDFARIAVVGRLAISHLADTRDDKGIRENNDILAKRLTKKGFVLLDHQHKMKGAILYLAKAIKQGTLKTQEDIVNGIENTPSAFFTMLDGKNQGKQIVKLGEIDNSILDSSHKLGNILTARKFPTLPIVKRLTGISINQ